MMYQPKRKQSTNYLEMVSKTLSIVVVSGLILSSSMAFNYLGNINQLSVFPDVMSNSSSLVAAIVVMGILFLLVLLNFIVPYGFWIFWSDIEKNPLQLKFFQKKAAVRRKAQQEGSPLLSWLWLWCWLANSLVFILLFLNIKIKTWCLLVALLGIYSLFTICLWNNHVQSVRTSLVECLKLLFGICVFNFLAFYMYLITIIYLIYQWLNQVWVQLAFIIGFCLVLAFNAWVAGLNFYHYSTKKKKANRDWLSIIFIFSLMVTVLITFFSENFTVKILNIIRFVETPANASWYLLHNNFQKNDGTQETNGIDKMDLLKLKERFRPKMDDDKNENVHQPAKRNNALYGYMAWNLGNTKIFCPVTVPNYVGTEENIDAEKFKQCLVIDGKFL